MSDCLKSILTSGHFYIHLPLKSALHSVCTNGLGNSTFEKCLFFFTNSGQS